MVRIDTVYQRVLALANKEQRGYITPQEFNLYANQVQMDIFEEYFYDIGLYNRAPKNTTEYSNPEDITDDKLAAFKKKEDTPVSLGQGLFEVRDDVYKLGIVKYQEKYIVDEVQEDELIRINSSPLTIPNRTRPVYSRFANNFTIDQVLQVYPTSITSQLTYNYIKKPSRVTWGYVVVNGNALYNSATSVNFELHMSEQSKLVYKILSLAGINLKDPNLYQMANAEEQKDINQQKS
ncbi:hypothetical protein [uncultured Mediterranean phage]|nr:hypothetical protein [uncultured Mediterranean phage]